MIHVPEKFASVEEMFLAVDISCRLDRPNFNYNWWGVNLFPYEERDTPRCQKYIDADMDADMDDTHCRKFSDADRIRVADKFRTTFPKCAAAAGYNGKNKPSKAAERGWILYRNKTLMVCRYEVLNISRWDRVEYCKKSFIFLVQKGY